MPILKIFYDDKLDPLVRANRTQIQEGLERMMREVLLADPDHCQVIMCASIHCTPKPVYVDMQFRAKEHRTREVVAQAMEAIAEVMLKALAAGVRIRAFDIDQVMLHALDVEGEG
jgi:3-oxoacyl-[acyl-carrier-protein] synthase III